MTITEQITPFQEALETCFEEKDASSPLYSRQKLFWERYKELGLPSKKSEAYQYLPLKKIYTTINSSTSTDAFTTKAEADVVFRNGQLDLSQSSMDLGNKVHLLPLEEAVKKFGTHLQSRFQKNLQSEKDPFALLGQSLATDSLFFYVSPNTKLETPLKVLHIIDENAPLIFPNFYLFLGANAEVTFVQETQQLDNSSTFQNIYFDCHLEKHASLSLYNYSESSKQGTLFHSIRASLKESSRFYSHDFSAGTLTRSDYHVSLLEPHAECFLGGAWLLNEKSQAHVHVLMEHIAPECTSTQLFKGILFDHAKSSFEGKIYVHKEAQKTESYQSNHNLLLSDNAFAASKPNLEIFADDVKASHGCTVGQLDPDQLFYLETRGIPKEHAKHLLVQAFCKDILDQVPLASWREKLTTSLLSKLPKQGL